MQLDKSTIGIKLERERNWWYNCITGNLRDSSKKKMLVVIKKFDVSCILNRWT